MLNSKLLPVLSCLLLSLAGVSRAGAQPAPEIAVYAGRFAVLDGDGTGEAGLEWRGTPRRFRGQPRWLPDLRPVVGAMATSHNDTYVYAGVAAPFLLGDGRWMLTPSFAPGVYSADKTRLGGPVEFRSAVALTYRLRPESWLGLAFYHLSNAGLYYHNPGSESLVLTFIHRLGGRH